MYHRVHRLRLSPWFCGPLSWWQAWGEVGRSFSSPWPGITEPSTFLPNPLLPQAFTFHLRRRDDGSKLDTPLRQDCLRRRPMTRRSCSPLRARRIRDLTLRGNHGLWMQIHKDRPALRMREGSERLISTQRWSALQTASVVRYLP